MEDAVQQIHKLEANTGIDPTKFLTTPSVYPPVAEFVTGDYIVVGEVELHGQSMIGVFDLKVWVTAGIMQCDWGKDQLYSRWVLKPSAYISGPASDDPYWAKAHADKRKRDMS